MAQSIRTERRRLLFGLLGAVLLVGCPNDIHAARANNQLVYAFDFEEREQGNYEPLPMHWYVIGRQAKSSDPNFHRLPLHQEMVGQVGFPAYADIRFDTEHRTSGEHSFYLGLNGGNAGAFLEVGALPAVPNSDYLITANVRTDRLKRSQARLVAYFVDSAGNRIDASLRHSPLVQTKGEWQQISVNILGDYLEAAWIGIQVELIQQEAVPDSPLGSFQIVLKDVSGDVWIDDITIWQVPRVVVRSQNRVNIIRAPDRPQLQLQVCDLTGHALVAHASIYDHRYRLIGQMQQRLGAGLPSSWRWNPPLDHFGWYLVDLSIRESGHSVEHDAPIARTLASLLWLSDEQPLDSSDDGRFTLGAEDLSDEQLLLLPTILEQTKIASITISAWDRDTSKIYVDQRQAQLDPIIQDLLNTGRQVTLSLTPLPDELVRTLDIDADSALWLFSHPISAWRPYLAPVVLRQGQRVRLWNLGNPAMAQGFFRPNLPDLVRRMTRSFRDMAPHPRLLLPWRLDQARRSDLDSAAEQLIYALHVPTSVAAHDMDQYLDEWTHSPPLEFLLHLEEPPANQLTHLRRVTDLALRMIYGWEAGASGLTISQPWAFAADRHTLLLPDPLLGVFTSVAHRLAGRRVVGRLPLDDGLECLILDGPAGDMLVAWNRYATEDDAVMHMNLGPEPVAIDVWGNRNPLKLHDRKHRLGLNSTPTFIEGVDSQLALLRASYRVEPPFIASRQVPHRRTITFRNPWHRTISGHMIITEPEEWRIEPRRTYFSVAAGQSMSLPIELMFPGSEVAGKKKLVARMDFVAEKRFVVDLTAKMELGLPGVRFDANLGLERNETTGAVDAIVTQLITNTGDEMLNLYAFANLPGYPRQERIISRLLPAQTIVRHFRFPDALEKLREANIRVGVRETSGPAVLNQILSTMSSP